MEIIRLGNPPTKEQTYESNLKAYRALLESMAKSNSGILQDLCETRNIDHIKIAIETILKYSKTDTRRWFRIQFFVGGEFLRVVENESVLRAFEDLLRSKGTASINFEVIFEEAPLLESKFLQMLGKYTHEDGDLDVTLYLLSEDCGYKGKMYFLMNSLQMMAFNFAEKNLFAFAFGSWDRSYSWKEILTDPSLFLKKKSGYSHVQKEFEKMKKDAKLILYLN